VYGTIVLIAGIVTKDLCRRDGKVYSRVGSRVDMAVLLRVGRLATDSLSHHFMGLRAEQELTAVLV
jgi:hypothetical protein